MNEGMQSFLERMQAIDRRWIFLFIALAVIIPFAFEFGVKTPATPEVKAIYDQIEGMEDNSRVLVAFDFDPPSEPELLPMATSYVRHLALRGHRIYFMTLWPVGQQEVERVVANVLNAEFPDYEYGVDYVELGFKTGNQGVIQGLLSDFVRQYPTDVNGTPLAEIPMMEGIATLADVDLILNVSAGYPGLKEWVQFGGDPTGVPVAGGVTAVSAPLLYPYYPGQLFGLMGGLQAAAEYESLLMDNYPERYDSISFFAGMQRMGPQTFAHLVIILFIIVGNIAWMLTRRGGPRLKSLGRG